MYWKIIGVASIFIAMILLSLLYFYYPVTTNLYYPGCPLYSFTGIFCPGCGAQRAFSSILHGQALQAINYNLLFVISLPIIIYFAAQTLLNVIKGEQVKQNVFSSPLFYKIVLVVVIVFWISRNIPVYPFNLLAPHNLAHI